MSRMLDHAKHILTHSDSKPNELMVGMLHFIILPLAMLELGDPNIILQISASLIGLFQLYSVLLDGSLYLRKSSAQAACMIAGFTVLNFIAIGMMKGSHLGWALIFLFTIWNCYRLSLEEDRLKAMEKI